MKIEPPLLNLQVAWAWIVLGFLSGMILGVNFHRENWLGGYGSFRRRLYRLGHISFFGLGAVNLMFCLTVESLASRGGSAWWPGWAFVLGAVTMPICCFATAHKPRLRALFAVPVISLLGGGLVVLWRVLSVKLPL